MNNRVAFRNLEERDVDFIYKAKNKQHIRKLVISSQKDFTYQDAESWLRECMKQDSNYKYWAICTNDEFQNIVGWCSIANIDHENRKAYFHGVTIADANFNDGIAWYETYRFIADYVFNVLDFNRLYGFCLTTNEFTMSINSLIFNSLEGVLKSAVYKDGRYYDVAIHAILKEDYERYMSQGYFDYENFMCRFKTLRQSKLQVPLDLSGFVKSFASQLDITDPLTITPETKFKELEEWSSLLAIDYVAVIEKNFNISLNMYDLIDCESIKDLYDVIIRKINFSAENNGELNISERLF